MAKTCLKCGSSLDDAAKFCPKCGSAYGAEPICAKCGRRLAANARFCPGCGAEQRSAPSEPSKNSAGKGSHVPSAGSRAAAQRGKSGAKIPAKYGILALVLVLLIGAGMARGSNSGSSSTPKNCQWAKSHLDDGTMFIYTVDELPGTATDASGEESRVYMGLYQDKDSFFVTLKDADKNVLYNSGSAPLAIDATIIFTTNSGGDFPQAFSATMDGGSNIVRFSPTSNGYIQSALEQENMQSKPLTLRFPDGSEYHVTMPGKNTYHEIWEAVCDFWYIPTDNDDIYTGKDVHPDLISFLDTFETAFTNEIEERKEAGTALTLLGDLLNINSNPELNAMCRQFMDLKYLTRRVDVEYYAASQARVEAALVELGLDQAVDISRGLEYIFRWLGL